MVVIPCVNHKTGPQGIARHVATIEDEEILVHYDTLVRTRLTPKPGCENLFFLTHLGSKYTQVHRKITESINANDVNIAIPPPPSVFRIGMLTKEVG